MAKLKAAGVSADYFEIDSDYGHSASGLDAAKWAPRLKSFMRRRLMAKAAALAIISVRTAVAHEIASEFHICSQK